MITIIFIVNGVDVRVDAGVLDPLSKAKTLALKETNNTGRPFDEWEVHNDEGYRLDDTQTLSILQMHEADRVFLNLKVGAGGAA